MLTIEQYNSSAIATPNVAREMGSCADRPCVVPANRSAPRAHQVRLTRLTFRHAADDVARRLPSGKADLTPQVSASRSDTVIGRHQTTHRTLVVVSARMEVVASSLQGVLRERHFKERTASRTNGAVYVADRVRLLVQSRRRRSFLDEKPLCR